MTMRFLMVFMLLCTTANAQQIMRSDRLAGYKSILPNTTDPLAREIFDSPDTIWYTHREMHPRTQGTVFPRERFNGQPAGIRGINSVYSNPGPNNRSQANREYPWNLTLGGGSHSADNLKTLKGLLLPRDDNGRLLPVVVFGSSPTRWSFPNGAIIAEVAWLVRDGRWYPVEIRLRQREPDDWRTSRLTPYESRDDLVDRVAQTHTQIASMIPNGRKTRMRIKDRHPRLSLSSTAVVQELPAFPPELTIRILNSEFVPTEGVPYADDADGPTTVAGFHIRPKGDLTQNHGTGSRESCRQCHRDIGRHARVFDMNREWYLNVRGSDGIFSYNPFDNNLPSQNAPPILRTEFVRSGTVARFDRRVHTAKHYSRSQFLSDEIRRGVN